MTFDIEKFYAFLPVGNRAFLRKLTDLHDSTDKIDAGGDEDRHDIVHTLIHRWLVEVAGPYREGVARMGTDAEHRLFDLTKEPLKMILSQSLKTNGDWSEPVSFADYSRACRGDYDPSQYMGDSPTAIVLRLFRDIKNIQEFRIGWDGGVWRYYVGEKVSR